MGPVLMRLSAQHACEVAAERFKVILLIIEPLFMGNFHFEKRTRTLSFHKSNFANGSFLFGVDSDSSAVGTWEWDV